MRVLRWLAMLLLVFAATTPSHEALAQGNAYSYVANTAPPDAFLALKAWPSLNSPRIMAMVNGTKLEVLLRRTDGWWYVRVSPTGEEGWAFSGRGAKAYILCCADSGGATSTSTRLDRATSRRIEPGAASPTAIARATGKSTSRSTVRLSGRAPYAGE